MGMLATATLFFLLCLTAQFPRDAAITAGTPDGMQKWGYITIRPKAHMFWLLYKSPQRVSSPAKPWPTIMWLAGGPGVSGVGSSNFEEIGPLDVNLKPRNTTWLQKADLLFVDAPVGVGFSYVDDPSALAKTDLQVAMDVTELIKALVNELPTLQSSPLHLVGESYGGKFAAMIGVNIARSIRAGSLNLTLGGVVLGGSWISPEDFALAAPLFLHSMSRMDDNAVGTAITMGITVKQQVAAQQFLAAYDTYSNLTHLIYKKSGHVNINNIMAAINTPGPENLTDVINSVIKEEFGIIPMNLTWQEVSLNVFDALTSNFMRPAINEARKKTQLNWIYLIVAEFMVLINSTFLQVDELLMYDVSVTVYNGQLDVICPTIGAESWLKKLKWDGLHQFLSLPRDPWQHCTPNVLTQGFVRSYKNLHFYWVIGAGHMVPMDQPCIAVHMIGNIVKSPVEVV
ncbi:hypothetical protein EJB05_42146 [Eragrostis curvula]|uniref:Carboxypeptidase n=1 Tax=Eragrostis curvula TaxID=38414 RepID=A0A5J9TBK4_9POAL|nr:hypothetical protein EJB05_42146 [Eragrostis curvula]